MPLEVHADPGVVAAHIDAGLLSAREHPRRPWRILKYTDRAHLSGHWCPVTTVFRGLVVTDDNTVLARGLEKFHNAVDTDPAWLASHPRWVVTEKLDGSCGLIFADPDTGEPVVTTLGAFDSSQAEWAARWLTEHHPRWRPPPGWTTVVEIISPDNRIVVDYGDRAELVFLAAVPVGPGPSTQDHGVVRWPGPVVRSWDPVGGGDVLELYRREDLNPGGEGFVAWCPVDDARVKIKFPGYLAVHRLVTGAGPLHLWRAAAARDLIPLGARDDQLTRVLGTDPSSLGDLVEDLRAGTDPDEAFNRWIGRLPDELHREVTAAVDDLRRRIDHRLRDITGAARRIARAQGVDPDAVAAGDPDARRVFARALFSAPDGWTVGDRPVHPSVLLAALSDPLRARIELWRESRQLGLDL